MSIMVLIADDHAVVRDGLRMILESQPGIQVVGDEAPIHENIVDMLGMNRFEVAGAENGRAGLRLCWASGPI